MFQPRPIGSVYGFSDQVDPPPGKLENRDVKPEEKLLNFGLYALLSLNIFVFSTLLIKPYVRVDNLQLVSCTKMLPKDH